MYNMHSVCSIILHHLIGSSTRQMHAQLCVMVSDTPLGVILSSIQDSRQCEELYQRYLHDFVHSVHKCPHRLAENVNNEYKVQTHG